MELSLFPTVLLSEARGKAINEVTSCSIIGPPSQASKQQSVSSPTLTGAAAAASTLTAWWDVVVCVCLFFSLFFSVAFLSSSPFSSSEVTAASSRDAFFSSLTADSSTRLRPRPHFSNRSVKSHAESSSDQEIDDESLREKGREHLADKRVSDVQCTVCTLPTCDVIGKACSCRDTLKCSQL